MESRSEVEAMRELAKQLWERYFRPRAVEDLLRHSLDGYKASVVSNNGDGTLTVVRPFDTQTMTVRCPPGLKEEAAEGDQVIVIALGSMSNAFVLCRTDLSGLGQNARIGSIYLTTTWDGESSPYSQTVSVIGAEVTTHSKIDLQLTAAQLEQLLDDGVTGLTTVNTDGTVEVWAVGQTPSIPMALQCTVTEVM